MRPWLLPPGFLVIGDSLAWGMDLSSPEARIADRPERTITIRREAARLCRQMGWAPLHEVALPNGRRADILALRPDGDFVCVEVKSGVADFVVDAKWPEYRDFSDALYFAVDADFPRELLPADVGGDRDGGAGGGAAAGSASGTAWRGRGGGL